MALELVRSEPFGVVLKSDLIKLFGDLEEDQRNQAVSNLITHLNTKPKEGGHPFQIKRPEMYHISRIDPQ